MRPRASILTVGTELVQGLRLDTNTQEVARSLARNGFDVAEAVTVGDDPASLAQAIRRLSSRDDLVVVTGGLGPTHDDVTREAAAAALGLAISRQPDLEALLQPVIARHHAPDAAAHVLAQADVLDGARVIRPTTGTAPGQIVRSPSGGWVALLPGPPSEMRPMLAEVTELVAGETGATPTSYRELCFTGLPESDAQIGAQRVLEAFPGIGLTLLARPADVRIVLLDEGAGSSALDSAAASVAAALGEHCYSVAGETLQEVVVAAARDRGITLATAESCTGGMIAAALTDVPGASGTFRGAVVSYADDVKVDLLGVSATTLSSHGAVSPECATQMATGARSALGADISVAVTGIAGPDGGSAEKPVGLVWFAVASPAGVRTWKRTFPGDRAGVRTRATIFALDLLRREVRSQ